MIAVHHKHTYHTIYSSKGTHTHTCVCVYIYKCVSLSDLNIFLFFLKGARNK